MLLELFLALHQPARGAEPWTLEVVLADVDASRAGLLRCALFESAEGFPMDASRARARVAVKPTEGVCRFELPAGPARYAVAIGHDENGNGRVDANLFGIPREGWGTSQNVKPALRAPRFEESAFRVDSAETRLSVTLHY